MTDKTLVATTTPPRLQTLAKPQLTGRPGTLAAEHRPKANGDNSQPKQHMHASNGQKSRVAGWGRQSKNACRKVNGHTPAPFDVAGGMMPYDRENRSKGAGWVKTHLTFQRPRCSKLNARDAGEEPDDCAASARTI